ALVDHRDVGTELVDLIDQVSDRRRPADELPRRGDGRPLDQVQPLSRRGGAENLQRPAHRAYPDTPIAGSPVGGGSCGGSGSTHSRRPNWMTPATGIAARIPQKPRSSAPSSTASRITTGCRFVVCRSTSGERMNPSTMCASTITTPTRIRNDGGFVSSATSI